DWVVLGHSRAARWHSWVAVGREWRQHPALHSQECLHSLHPRELLGSLVWDRVSHQWEIMRRPIAAASPTPMESACRRTVSRVENAGTRNTLSSGATPRLFQNAAANFTCSL